PLGLAAYFVLSSLLRGPLPLTLFPYTTLFRSLDAVTTHGREYWWIPKEAPDFEAEGLPVILGGGDHVGHRELRSSRLEAWARARSEEHTSELQSRVDLVCRLLLEKKKRQETRT